MMESSESWERVWESLGRAASCCRELHIVTKIKDWGELSDQFLIMRKKAKAMYDGKPLSETEAWGDAYAAHAETGFPLSHGSRSRVGRLRGYGNAINATQAEGFITAFMEEVA